MSWNCNGVYGGVRECCLKIEIDAWASPQYLYRSSSLRCIIIAPAIERAPAPVSGSVFDEPFPTNIISIVTNTAVPTIRERYLKFRWGSDLLQNISCQTNQQRRERMTFRLLNDFKSDSDMMGSPPSPHWGLGGRIKVAMIKPRDLPLTSTSSTTRCRWNS